MSTLKVNNLQVGQDSTATNNLTWFQPGSPDGTIRLGSGNAGSATTKFTFDKDGNLTCVGTITATSIEGTIDDWIVHLGDTDTKYGFPAADTYSIETGGSERLRITSGGDIQVDNGNVHIDDNGEFAIFEQDTARAMTNSSKISMDFSGNVARIRSSHNGSGSNAVSRNLGFYIGSGQKLLITSTEITAAVQLNIESAGSYIKSNQLKFNPNGDAFIDHGVTSKDITFRLSNSSALDFNAIKIDSSAQQTKFGKQIVVGLQGGNDVTTIGGGSGIGAYIQLDHASSGINTKLMGNNDSYLNQFYGNLAIGEDAPDGNKLLIRAASTVGTTKGHIMLTGDGATNGEGPQIVFSESGSGSNFAGAYIGHIREGSNSTGSLVLGTRSTGGDASTVPTERIRIYATGQILYSAQGGDNQITSKRTNGAGSNGNYFFHLKATNDSNVNVGALGFHRDTNTDDSRLVFFTKKTGGSESLTERLRITSTGLVKWGGHTLSERNSATGVAGGMIYNSEGKVFQYHDGSGWITLNTTNQIVATGGNSVTTSGGYRIHDFAGGGTFEITSGAGEVEILVVGGGGSEGGGNAGCHAGGGGGGGGVVYQKINLFAGKYAVTVGTGGLWRNNGGTSTFGVGTDNTITALGGGAGGPTLVGNGNAGGSGGGGSRHDTNNQGGAATQPASADGGFGNAGGNTGSNTSPGGGGGAGGAGQSGSASNNGRGGPGKQFTQFGVNIYFGAGGNAGGTYTSEGQTPVQTNGAGNTGAGAGGSPGTGTRYYGGSGRVMIRYPAAS